MRTSYVAAARVNANNLVDPDSTINGKLPGTNLNTLDSDSGLYYDDFGTFAFDAKTDQCLDPIREPSLDGATTSFHGLRKALSQRTSWPLAEQRGAHYFKIIISASFTSNECSSFWRTWVPCILEQEEAIRLLVTAFALLHEAHDLATIDSQRIQDCERSALTHYNSAIRYIKRHGASTPPGTLAVTCILVVGIETLRGNLGAVKACIRSSLALSGTSKAAILEYRWTHPILDAESVPLERAIGVTQAKMSVAFDVFAIQTKPLVCQSEISASPMWREDENGFASVQDARTQAEKLVGATLRALESLNRKHRVVHDSATALATLHNFKDFHYRLDRFRSSVNCPLALAQLFRRTMIQEMKVLEAQIVFCAVVLDHDEMSFDNWTSSFERMLDIAHDCLAWDTTKCQHLVYHPFSVMFVPSLWLVASRCRVYTIRRRAIKLLQDYPRRERTFDSMVASVVASHIVRIEEGIKAQPIVSSEISGADRVTLHFAEFIQPSRCIRLTLLRGAPGSQDTVQEEIPWSQGDAEKYKSRWETVLNPLLKALLCFSGIDTTDVGGH